MISRHGGAAPEEACIIACGRGVRLSPFTDVLPKFLVPVADEPVLIHLLRQLRGWGLARVTVLLPEDQDIEAVHRALRGAPIPTRVATLRSPTWQVIHQWLAETYVSQEVLTLNCDLLLDPEWGGILGKHIRLEADLSLAAALAPGTHDGQYGLPRPFVVLPDGLVHDALPEGDPIGATTFHQVGLSVVGPRAWKLLQTLNHRGADPWADEFVPAAVEAGLRVAIFDSAAYWRDVGTWLRVWLAHRELAGQSGAPVMVSQTARIAPTASIEGWAYIGPNCQVHPGARVKDSVLLARSVVEPGGVVDEGLLMPDSAVSAGATITRRVHLPGHAPIVMAEMPRT